MRHILYAYKVAHILKKRLIIATPNKLALRRFTYDNEKSNFLPPPFGDCNIASFTKRARKRFVMFY